MEPSTSAPRVTRSSQRSATISNTLLSIAKGTAEVRTSGSSPHQSDFSFVPLENLPAIPEKSLPLDDRDHLHHSPEPQPSDHSDDQSETSEQSAPDANVPNLANALTLLARRIGEMPAPKESSASVKPRTPDTFDGSDPNKLETFVFQCSMYIAALSKDFPNDESRVTFTISYLKGTPLEWFQSELNYAMSNNGRCPEWFNSYPDFLAELQRHFGPHDPVNDATNALESLRYRDSSKATKYTLDFNRYARRTGWNESALTRSFYKGLPDRLKDEIARIGKPTRLTTLQTLVATLDQRHWERQAEISRDKRANNQQKPAENRPDRGQQSSNPAKPNQQQQQAKGKDQKKPASAAASSSSTNTKTTTNSIADVLGPDGKLKPEERQRRLDNKLCLRCGNTGHVVSDCPITSKPKPKGRAAKAAAAAAASTASPATTPASGKA